MEAGMQDPNKSGEGPLSSKELERDLTDGGATLPQEVAPGHLLPESERDPTETGSGRSGGVAGTILPPD
jgi:hypothetical protein